MSNLFKNIPHKLYMKPGSKYLHTGVQNEINYTKDIFSIGDLYCGSIKHNADYSNVITVDISTDDLLLYFCYYDKAYLITRNEEDFILLKMKYGL